MWAVLRSAGRCVREVGRALGTLRKSWYLLKWNKFGDFLRYYTYTVFGKVRVVRLCVAGRSIFVRTSTTDAAIARASFTGEFDQALSYLTGRAGLIIDAGAHIGTAAIEFAEALPNCRIVCVEPSSGNLDVLARNVAEYANIEVICAAIGGRTGSGKLWDRAKSGSGYTILQDAQDGASNMPVEEVDVLSIQDILELCEEDSILLLKMDIEGAEYDVFGGDVSWVPRCYMILIELHERIKAGCTRRFINATSEGREDLPGGGEKILSVTLNP